MTVETAPRRTEYLPLDHLTPDPANPKAHALAEIDASVGRFGFVEAITVDERTGYIVAGHGRRQVLHDMEQRGEAPPEGVLLDDSGRWLVPVQRGWASRTDAEARAYLIASNRTPELGGWVDESLMTALEALGGDLEGTGITDDDIESLRERLAESVSEKTETLSAGQGYVSAVPEFDGGKVDLGEGTHTCPRCRFTFDD